ncbi:MAG: hypothetical protein J7L38_03115 [Thermoproteales archaeon]|nr:hypothetical protein [Thermoproteales archaeon]
MRPEWEFTLQRDNKGYLVYGLILLFICMILMFPLIIDYGLHVHVLIPILMALSPLLAPSILLISLYFTLPRDTITVKGDTLYLTRGNKRLVIPFSRIASVHVVYAYSLTSLGLKSNLHHVTIKYREDASYSKTTTLKIGVLSWGEENVSELYRYLNLLRNRYKYEVKTIKTLLPFIY